MPHVLLTHHFRMVEEATGFLLGALTDQQADRVVALLTGAGVRVDHAGAALAVVADRVSVFSFVLGTDPDIDVLRDLGRIHFDLAGFPLPRQLDAIRTLTTDDHLHHGSDFPFTPAQEHR